MFPTTSSEVAVSYYPGWSWVPWTFVVLALALSIGLVFIGASAWARERHDDDPAALMVCIGCGVLATPVLAISLWQSARHTETFRIVILLALVIIAAVAIAAHYGFRAANTQLRGLGASVPGEVVAVPAAIAGVVAGGVLIGDGLNRAAAWVPTTVATLLILVGGFLLYGFLSAKSSRS